MSNGARQNPWSLMPRLQDEINRLFGNLNENDSSSATAAWVPPVDIQEYSDRFELYVDLPGVEPDKVIDAGGWRIDALRSANRGDRRGPGKAYSTPRAPSAATGISIGALYCRTLPTARA